MTSLHSLISLSMIILTSLASLSVSSLIGVWIVMEINMIYFCSFLVLHDKTERGSGMMYFIIQSLASMGMLLGYFLMTKSSSVILLQSSLLLKLGAAPFHSWFFMVLESISFLSLFIISTFQKIPPLALMGGMSGMEKWALMSLLVGVLGSLSAMYIKTLIGYSSLFSLGWLLTASSNLAMSLMYIMIYSVALSLICSMLEGWGENSMSSMIWGGFSWPWKFSLGAGFWSIGGIPPTIGFYAKIFLIFQISESFSVVISMLLLILSGPVLYQYLRIFFSNCIGGGSSSMIEMNHFYLIFMMVIYSPLILLF